MQSITHLIDSIESFSKQNFKFSQYFQPLNILNRISDSISDHLNNIDFIYHLDEASKHIDWLNRFFEDNINPVTKKKSLILNLLKTKMSKSPMLISRSMNLLYSKMNWLNSFLLKTSSMKRISVLSDEEILNLLHLMVYVLIVVLLKNLFTITIKAKVNINARLARILLPLKQLSKMRLVSTVLTANVSLFYIMIAMAILFTSA